MSYVVYMLYVFIYTCYINVYSYYIHVSDILFCRNIRDYINKNSIYIGTSFKKLA